MLRKTVIISGVNGFIGSNLASYFVKNNYDVVGLTRNSNQSIRTNDLLQYPNFLQLNYDLEKVVGVLENRPDKILIHAAWNGVTANERNDWEAQFSNLEIGYRLLEIVKMAGITKTVVLGSQAEYGSFSGRISEEQPSSQNTNYGFFKKLMCELWERYCNEIHVEWYWLRLFSVYGPGEDANWFISNLIQKLSIGQNVELTGCEQKYDYLYVEDLAKNIESIIVSDKRASGIYNLGSNCSVSLRSIAETVKKITGSDGELMFGKLPYRQGQIMHMEGNSDKFEKLFGLYNSNMSENIKKMIN